jgi:HEAT repeat protein
MLAQPKSHSLFASALADPDEGVRAAAAEGIGRLKSASTLPMVAKLFEEERKMAPRLAQAFAIVSLGKTELTEFSALQYLVNTLNSSAYQGVAAAYLDELARDANVREQLYTALENGTKSEKRGIVRVLAASGDKRSLDKIEPLTRDSDSDLAEESIRAVRVLRSRIM